jgi:hypothetical protein
MVGCGIRMVISGVTRAEQITVKPRPDQFVTSLTEHSRSASFCGQQPIKVPPRARCNHVQCRHMNYNVPSVTSVCVSVGPGGDGVAYLRDYV